MISVRLYPMHAKTYRAKRGYSRPYVTTRPRGVFVAEATIHGEKTDNIEMVAANAVRNQNGVDRGSEFSNGKA